MTDKIMESKSWKIERVHISFDDIMYYKISRKDDEKECMIVSKEELEELLSMHGIPL